MGSKKVEFKFDERSLATEEEVIREGCTLVGFDEEQMKILQSYRLREAQMRDEIKSLRAERDQARRHLLDEVILLAEEQEAHEKTRSALAPFAKIAEGFDPSDDPNAVWIDYARTKSEISGLTLRDFYNALRAYKGNSTRGD